MINNAMGTSQLTEADLIQIVESDGGGYVTVITRSGRAGTAGERTIVHAVLRTNAVSAAGPGGLGKPGVATSVVLCYRFTVGYYPHQVWQAQQACPQPVSGTAGGFAATALGQASQVYSDETAIANLPRAALSQVRAAPMSLSQARRLLGLDRRARRQVGILPLTASGFATGHGRAALALRLRGGGCIYLSLPDNPMAGCRAPG